MTSTSVFGRPAASSPDETNLTRALGPLEQFFYFADKFHPTHAVVAARIAGHVEPSEWRKALDAVQQSYPAFSLCISEDEGPTPVFRSAPAIPIALEVVEGIDPAAWQARFGRELSTPFDTKHGPLVRAVVFRDDEKSVFIMAAHHAIADGRSDLLAFLDVLRALSGQPVPLRPVGAPLEAAPALPIPRSSEASHVPRLLKKINFVRAAGLPARAVAQIASYFFRKMRISDTPAHHVVCRALPRDLTSRAAERAWREKTSLNGALCAALAEAGRRLCPDWTTRPVRLLCPFDTRQVLDLGEPIGHFSSVAPVLIAPNPSSFWDTARHALKSVSSGQTRKGVAHTHARVLQAADAGMDPVMCGMMMEHGLAHDIMLTNIGEIPPETIGTLAVEELWPASRIGYHDRLAVGAAIVNGSLHLVQLGVDGMLPQLLEKTEEVLAAEC
jgi:hypothetical protein